MSSAKTNINKEIYGSLFMDDFVQSNLYASRDEWSARLVTVLTPLIVQGIRSIFAEALAMCSTNGEQNKYLLCFQNMLCTIPKWNDTIIDQEKKRIIEKSGCGYLEDLITCVHIIQMKLLTCIRVGNKQKKIDISIPKLDMFIHKCYIHVARKVYMNVYLFETGISPLTIQKNNRELETIVQECILTAIRESIPTEAIIRAYLDESIEQEEEVIIEHIDDAGGEITQSVAEDEVVEPPRKFELPEEKAPPDVVPTIKNIDDAPVMNRLTFNDFDHIYDGENVDKVSAPKTIDRLEKISAERNAQRKMEEEDDMDDDEPREKIKINLDDPVSLMDLDIIDMDGGETGSLNDDLKLDFDEL